ncbi:beta-galactosidase [Neorhizobium sp. S3-V5DH]|uniref:beta-galactosidase n=1 Tax=Neorhizobium sp. S3-V5DH TaxID=2485166 RepID=UPI00104E5441|nr:beta-galactosidase [Neorhizobium sp. S3-V5DH]TCV74541.1 beta-galactosidase [Neorhizobium sp. S3-V5DH]
MPMTDLQFPYGAVYFRKSNPPQEHWERDYAVAAQDGLNIFRHWFMWGAIETAPGVYDWEEYDRQLDLAAKNGLKTVIAELIHAVPDWAVRKFSHALQVNADGSKLGSYMGVSAATGGFSNNGGGAGALTLNCPEVKEAAGAFLTALATRYKDHPAIYGYDVWNECNYSADVDYSSYAKEAFRTWLEAKYGSLKALAKAWHRYSYAEWDDIEPPIHMAPYPECIDWLQFKRDNFYGQMQWRIDTIRAVDKKNVIAAHGISGAIPNMAANGCDDWLAASKVDVYGFTWIQARKGTEPWKSWYGVDINRAAARGKTFWHAERQGGPLWLQPQVIGRDKEDGRVAEPEDIRIWSMISLAGGARGVLNLRWRPLLDGPLFGAFGSYGMDGSRTPRSQIASAMAKWANAPEQAALWKAKPVRGEIGILVVPETQEWDYLLNQERKEKPYPAAMWGAYRGFLDQGLQPDWVHIDDIDAYDLLYFPYPIMFTSEQARRLAAWVDKGGTLIAEACPGYFGDRGHVGQVQPNLGLDTVFGAREEEVEFMPDIGDRIALDFGDVAVKGGGFLQSYRLEGGTARGYFADGRLAVVEHAHGKGRTLLIGTNPSAAYYRSNGSANAGFFAALLDWSEVRRHVTLSNSALSARIHQGDTGNFLWLVNPTRESQTTLAEPAQGHGAPKPGPALWPAGYTYDGGPVQVPARDVVILPLVPAQKS